MCSVIIMSKSPYKPNFLDPNSTNERSKQIFQKPGDKWNSEHYMVMREEIIEPNIKYSKIGENRRVKLIDLVVHQEFKIRRAARMLKINESTAKSILKHYRDTGSVSGKQKQPRTANHSKNHSQSPREPERKNGTPPTIENQGRVPKPIEGQYFPPQLFYYYAEPTFPTFYVMLPPSIL